VSIVADNVTGPVFQPFAFAAGRTLVGPDGTCESIFTVVDVDVTLPATVVT
jgi:hypothetical protein